MAVTLGLEPGPQASSRLFFPAEEVYGSSPELKRAVEELERKGVAVRETGWDRLQRQRQDSRAAERVRGSRQCEASRTRWRS